MDTFCFHINKSRILLKGEQNMAVLKIDNSSSVPIQKSFDKIAEDLFNNYQLHVNNSIYRLVDIEFYYFSKNHPDIYAHKHKAQKESDHWYFHGSGIDITFGDGNNHGGILIRAICEISDSANKDKYYIKDEYHGPVNVKTEICSKFNNIFEDKPNIFQFNNINNKRPETFKIFEKSPIKTKRIGLNLEKDEGQVFYSAKYRYVAYVNLKYAKKTQIAHDMKEQYDDMLEDDINNFFGWKILK